MSAQPRPSGQVKRSVNLAGHATSIALEPEFWAVLEAMAEDRGASLAALIKTIDTRRGRRPLASACRLAALEFARTRPDGARSGEGASNAR